MSDKRVLAMAVGVNSLLFLLKTVAWFGSKSFGLLSDAVNSGSDILLYSVLIAVAAWSSKAADKDHPFGHSRGEPVGAVVAGIFIAVVALELAWRSLLGLFHHHTYEITPLATGVLLISVLSKLALGAVFVAHNRKKSNPLTKAAQVDVLADAAASSVALVGLLKAGFWDPVAGILVAAWIGLSSWAVIKENLSFLVGRSPESKTLQAMMQQAMTVPGVKRVKGIRAHHVGPEIHLEITITVSPELSLARAHDIGDAVRQKLESMDLVQQAFVHIDPD